MNNTYETIREYVDSLYVVDTHEHLPGNINYLTDPKYRDPRWDILSEYLLHYISSDLRSAGLPAEDLNRVIGDYSIPLSERWEIIEPYWNAVRYTGYARALDIAVQDIYGLPGINRRTIEEANELFRASYGKDQYEKVLKEKSKIIVSILDRDILDRDIPVSDRGCDLRYFRSVFQLEEFYFPKLWDDIKRVENDYSTKMSQFTDWLDTCEAAIDRAIADGAIALKMPMAYTRSLSVERWNFHEAETVWNSFYSPINRPDWAPNSINASKPFQDYVIHFILSRISKRGIPIQIHTGLLEGSGNYVSDSNPVLLSNLFLEYPDIKFDVFHMGYPYQQELSALAKMFPNVFIDMCWGHIISPIAAQNALIEWIDAVPINKISAFGGDYLFADGIYGHLVIARHNVSVSLAAKVQSGMFDADEAKAIAKRLFADNPAKLFGLDDLIQGYN